MIMGNVNQTAYTAQTVERKVGGVVAETKENLTKLRRHELNLLPEVTGLHTKLEQTYGKYLFVPYNIPSIKIKDLEKFILYFNNNAKHASKTQIDFASATFNATDRTYRSIDSVTPGWAPIWSLNALEKTYTEFPEIFEQIHDYMPWVGNKDFPWNMWSSAADIIPHRDNTSLIDAPLSMRVKLFDNNASETLYLLTDPIKQHTNKYIPIPQLAETNSFAWNNLRTKHRSLMSANGMKVLFIWRGKLITNHQVNQYVDLLDRSIAKYKDTQHLWVDNNSTSDYLNLD